MIFPNHRIWMYLKSVTHHLRTCMNYLSCYLNSTWSKSPIGMSCWIFRMTSERSCF